MPLSADQWRAAADAGLATLAQAAGEGDWIAADRQMSALARLLGDAPPNDPETCRDVYTRAREALAGVSGTATDARHATADTLRTVSRGRRAVNVYAGRTTA